MKDDIRHDGSTELPSSNQNLDNIEEIDSSSGFRPPEDYQTSEFSRTNSSPTEEDIEVPEPSDQSTKNNKGFLAKIKNKVPNLNKKQWLLVCLVCALLLAGIGFLTWKVFFNNQPQVKQTPVAKQETKPAPTTAPSKLTGIEVSIADSSLPTTAVMIENSPDARPQSGLSDAGVVYEAVAEGGITRFLTLFQESQPASLGPVRSVRPYYLDWLVPFDAPVAHVGGSAEALAQIRAEGIKDLDYGTNSGSYQRVSNRYAPHNVYTSRAQLLELQKSKGWTSSKFTGFARKKESPSQTITAKAIDFAISSPLYNPHFDYDVASNSYLRSQAGQPHIDEKSGKQISSKVIVAIVVPKSIHPDGVHTIYATHGSGKAYFFQDGMVTEGIWEKKDRKSEMRFGDVNGSPFALNAGNTWISVVGEAGAVTYTP